MIKNKEQNVKTKQITRLDDLTLELNFDLAILYSAVSNPDKLEICALNHFVEKIYYASEEIRNIFDNEIIY